MIEAMGDLIKSRPAFADKFTRFEKHKLGFVKRCKPYLYVGTDNGIRSSFCSCLEQNVHNMMLAIKKVKQGGSSGGQDQEETKQDDEKDQDSEGDAEVKGNKLVICDACQRLQMLFSVWNGFFMHVLQAQN